MQKNIFSCFLMWFFFLGQVDIIKIRPRKSGHDKKKQTLVADVRKVFALVKPDLHKFVCSDSKKLFWNCCKLKLRTLIDLKNKIQFR